MRRIMATLDDHAKQFIVQALACFDTPSQVVTLVKDELGIDINRQQVQSYDPTRVAGRQLAPKWRAIFEATRQKFLDETAKIPIASQSYRLRRLQRLHEEALQKRNAALAAALLEQAAKEMGGAFTNTRQLSGPGGGAIPVTAEVLHTLTDDDLARIAAKGSSQPAA